MTVKELLDYLQTQDPTALVVLSSDPEGNSYSPLSGYADSHYVASSGWCGEIYDTISTDDPDDEDEEDEDTYYYDADSDDPEYVPVKAVVLWP